MDKTVSWATGFLALHASDYPAQSTVKPNLICSIKYAGRNYVSPSRKPLNLPAGSTGTAATAGPPRAQESAVRDFIAI